MKTRLELERARKYFNVFEDKDIDSMMGVDEGYRRAISFISDSNDIFKEGIFKEFLNTLPLRKVHMYGGVNKVRELYKYYNEMYYSKSVDAVIEHSDINFLYTYLNSFIRGDVEDDILIKRLYTVKKKYSVN